MGVSRAVWPALFLSLLLFGAAAALAVLGPVRDPRIGGRFPGCPERHEVGPIAQLVGLLGVVYAVTAAVDVVRGRLWGTIGSRMNRDLRSFVFGKLQALSLAYFRARRAGDLLNRVGSDTERVQRFIWMWASEGVRHVFLIIAVGVVLMVRDPRLAALVIAPVPVVIFLFWLLYRPARYAYTQELHLRDVVEIVPAGRHQRHPGGQGVRQGAAGGAQIPGDEPPTPVRESRHGPRLGRWSTRSWHSS